MTDEEKAPEPATNTSDKAETSAGDKDGELPGCGFIVKEPYKCRFCGLSYVYLTTLRAHERVHGVEAPYTCSKCGEAFRAYSELEYHSKTHKDQKMYRCQCGRSFYKYTDLLYHKHPGSDDEDENEGIVQEGKGQGSNRGFRVENPMKLYTEDIGRRPYICQYCSKSYSESRDLKNHMYGHRGERAYNPLSSRYLMGRM